jgi:hypothetical protein
MQRLRLEALPTIEPDREGLSCTGNVMSEIGKMPKSLGFASKRSVGERVLINAVR